MNKILIALAAAALPVMAAADNSALLNISQMSVNKGDSLITVNLTVDPRAYRIPSDNIVTLTPILASATDTLELDPVRIAGRQAWYNEIRNGLATPLTLSRARKSLPVLYSSTIVYDPAFETSELLIRADTSTICNCRPPREGIVPVARLNYRPIEPSLTYHYVAPTDSAEKIFNLSGRANVIFKVNRTEIDWTYFGNHAELDTILATINAVRDNPDATVKEIFLTGYASPEGPYLNNVRLAKGRTEAVRDYVAAHSSFPADIYHTASVPEDWAGLRQWIADHEIDNKEAMLAFIDDKTIPEPKRNDLFRARFPRQYPFLLKEVYPTLRHTDYRITYSIRKFYQVEDIRRVFRSNPRYLSLNELFILANSYQPGSPEHEEVFDVAARLYPESTVANLNAANSAMNRGKLEQAERYLSRAGQSPEVDYARGVLAIQRGDLQGAVPLLQSALRGGVKEAREALDEIERVNSYRGTVELL